MNFDVSDGLLAISGLRSVVPDFNCIYQFLGSMGFYNISPRKLRSPQADAEVSPLDEGGRNLCAVLRHLREKHPAESRNLISDLKAVVPGIADYSVKSAGEWLVTDLRYELSKPGLPPPSFKLALESDGTLRMLGILAALCQVPHLPLLAIEEPELNIHPDGSGILGDVLLEAGLRSQVLVTTHSPDLIDTFSPDILRVVEKEDGVTKVGPLLKSQSEAVAENLFSPGELMRIDGLQRETEV
ncbi:AAA family ATPase [Desulfobacterales bacterium HSG2]|nr:AAA family ATPase [Desulfobacterales bacterium HSG2]